MNRTILNRRLLQADLYAVDSNFSPDTASRNPINGTSTTIRRPFRATTPFDFSMAVTVLVLLAVLFFMGFFYVYMRRFTAGDPTPSSSSSSSSSDNVTPRRNPPPTSNNHKGLDPSAMKSLPLVPYGVAAKHQIIEDCPICLSEFEETEIVKLITYCRHVFHPRCIDKWLSSHVTCPICRSTQLFHRVEEVCLDVKQEKLDIGVSEIGERERSTVINV